MTIPIPRRPRAAVLAAIGALALALTACTATTDTPPPEATSDTSSARPTEPSVVEIAGGELLGYTDDGVHTFRGVPYATAPRFQRSVPIPAWEDTRPALTYGPTCLQSANDAVSLTEFINFSGGNLPQNEECLYANIWSASLDAEANKPVIFWIHGGGYSTGAANELSFYDGRNIAATGDAVFVSVNHRLNVLGYTDLSAAGDAYADTGSLGQLDLVDALTWVRENIAYFGGDPDNITIIGQSGGGGKVLTLMGMPEAEGLFQQAVAMSPMTTWRDAETAREQTDALYAAAGVTPGDVDALSALPYLDLLAASREAEMVAGPVVGTDVLPAAPVSADGGFTPLSADVPLIVSTVLGEFASNLGRMSYAITDPADPLADAYAPGLDDPRIDALLAARFGERADEVTEAFVDAYPGHAPEQVLWIEDGSFFGGGRVLVSEARAAQDGAAPVYTAVTAKTLPVFGGVTPPHTGGDIPFWFGNADKMRHIVAGEEAEFAALQEVATGALLRFAATGDPGSDELDWPAYTPADQTVMVFDSRSEARDHHEVELYALLAEIRAGA